MTYTYRHWDSFLYFYSASSVQSFLKNCYQKQNIELADQRSFENCYPFIYYLEHGQVYYEQAEKAPLIIKPILLFYGLVHLVKACILTVDPNYPETTSVLAHGVTTRKRKKQQYNFFQDEVKFQKSGLFPYMGEKLFHMKHLEGEKTTMGELLKQISELHYLFLQTEGKHTFIQIEKNNDIFSVPNTILDGYHMTEARFIDYFKTKFAADISHKSSDNKRINFKVNISNRYDHMPMRFHIDSHHYYLPFSKESLNDYPELLIHYLLLYNLSMIARYETEWWSELIKMMSNNDYPFIQSFLNITSKKGPFLIYQYLIHRK